MDGILTAMALLGSCVIGYFVGMVFVFAGVRAAGYVLSYRQGRWSINRIATARAPGAPGTMRSLN